MHSLYKERMLRATITEDWCKICDCSAIDPVSTPCGQVYCKSCIWMLPLYQERMLRATMTEEGPIFEGSLIDPKSTACGEVYCKYCMGPSCGEVYCKSCIRMHSLYQERMLIATRMTEPCPICMGDLAYPVFTKCLHVYCKSCIESWLRCGYTTCPMCVRNVVDFKRQVTVPPVFNFRIPKNTEELYLDILQLFIIFFKMVLGCFGLQVPAAEVAHTSIRRLPMVYIEIY